MSQPITFGTDGWRAVIADGFTFDNVRRVSEAIAVAARGLEPPQDIDRNALVVGFDRRFLSREFPQWRVESLSAEQDLEHSLSAAYPRAMLRKGASALAAIAAPPDGQDTDGVLSFGLIWLD